MKAIIFGSLNALCDLSDIERRAFNIAFSQSGLPWKWDAQTYREMSCRLMEAYEPSSPDRATARDVNFDDVLSMKDEILFELIEDMRFPEDPVIQDAFDFCRRKGIYRGLISQQARLIVNSVRAGMPGVMAHDFSAVTCRCDEDRPRTRQHIYSNLAEKMRVDLSRCLAVETTHRGIETALLAGVGRVVAHRVKATPEQEARGVIDASEDLVGIFKLERLSWNAPRKPTGRRNPSKPRRLTATPSRPLRQSA